MERGSKRNMHNRRHGVRLAMCFAASLRHRGPVQGKLHQDGERNAHLWCDAASGHREAMMLEDK